MSQGQAGREPVGQGQAGREPVGQGQAGREPVSQGLAGGGLRVVCLTALGDPLLAGAAALFDEYRQHYGANPAPEAVTSWMRELVLSGKGRIYAAGRGDRAIGICSTAVVPAALTLRTVWLVRDLYVAPDMRRHGVARALLTHVADDARAAGAHRLSLRTETANTQAIALYARNGFDLLSDVAVMERLL
ncbi:GNAT family N-acetyltransferase [Actinoplanes subtropicus]|uniref:GNAT family N-acetyltransferase n=1 Tax=Actinoplanes subtropicus TaxID=543632 RepID=UPI00068EF203|nr:GNAT family N-acetyltransferase [Actinoplanes subtropicus]